MLGLKNDSFFMKEAMREAQKAFSLDEVPVGAVVVHKNKIIARAYNQVEMLKDPTAHAEMLVLTEACNFLRNKWLLDCTIYVTIEPCSMCAGALVLSRIKKIVYGAVDPKTGACGSVINLINNKKLNHRLQVKTGVLEKECSLLIKEFFLRKRQKVATHN
ncbi:MAG: tRNA adenosine(34) deaminase TadA [Candidatus Omnitrophica bacterium]|nr:tRNA adenosine(34) deaminase TadA [Candidatus Omnitrophota bacterium]MDD5352845.1 tRNA adenosine(34) deaminase TadA [Candidatus Omnitrophota bacterium]MDD5550444.1 tRNA adenosine(34) deaminase TadA [Candidatus Omnitrophota bacterium]